MRKCPASYSPGTVVELPVRSVKGPTQHNDNGYGNLEFIKEVLDNRSKNKEKKNNKGQINYTKDKE